MPIGGYVPSSAISKPGVIANSAARPSSPYNGQVVYQTDTGQAFVWNGSSWVLLSTGTANPPGLELVKTQTIGSGVSTVTVSNCFSSAYENYRVTLSGGVNSVDGSYLRIRFDAGGTSNYYGSLFYDLYTGTNTGYARTNGGAQGDVGITSTEQSTTSFDIFGPNGTKRKYISGVYSGGYIGYFGFQSIATTQYTDITFFASSGTYTGGTIRVYGYKN